MSSRKKEKVNFTPVAVFICHCFQPGFRLSVPRVTRLRASYHHNRVAKVTHWTIYIKFENVCYVRTLFIRPVGPSLRLDTLIALKIPRQIFLSSELISPNIFP